MDNKKRIINKKDIESRKKRVKNIKRTIIVMVILLLVLPSVCCLTFFVKLMKLENQVDTLTSMHDQEYNKFEIEDVQENEKSNTVHAAEKEIEPEKEIVQEKEAKEEVDQQTLEGKKVYLTFDDGPSKNTEQILDILKEYDVKATFFVIGKTDSFSKSMYQRIFQEGHTLAMHSYSHQYRKIYKSVNAFKKDINELSDLIYEVTGERPKYFRFPGGSSNTVSALNMKEFIKYANKKGLVYFDWNVINGDATGKKLTVKQLIHNVMTDVEKYDTSVVLMHDSADKVDTVTSLPQIIKKLKKNKMNILPINDTTNPVQHIKAETVK